MKRTLLLTLMVLLVAGAATAQVDVGSIGVFADATGSSCDITDVATLFNAYIVHVNATQGNSCQFKLEQDPDVNITFISGSVNDQLLSLGSVENGIAISYVGCKTTFPLELVELSYFGTATTTSCGKLSIVNDPTTTSGFIEIFDCNGVKHILGTLAGTAQVNAAGDCGCDVATKESTWSNLKALYQ